MRRLSAVVLLVILSGCASPAETAAPAVTQPAPASSSVGLATENPRPSGPIVPWLDESALTAPSPTPVPVPPGTPACLPSDLSASAGWQGGGGQMLGSLTVTNVGAQPCALNGPLRLVELRASTAAVGPIDYRADGGDGSNVPGSSAGPVLLEPGGRAGAYLWWSNWCGAAKPLVTSLAVTLPSGGVPLAARAASPGPGFGGVPRCDVPSAASTFTAYAFTPVAPDVPAPSPQPASAVLSAPSTAAAGADLVYYVTLKNLGDQAAPMDPCPTYSEGLVVGGVAVKLPGAAFMLLNCAVIGPALDPGAFVQLEMRLPVPSNATAGPAVLRWGLDAGGPLDTSAVSPHATLTIVAPGSANVGTQPAPASAGPSPSLCARAGASALAGVVESRPAGWSSLAAAPAPAGFPGTSGQVYGPAGSTAPPYEGPGRLVLYETLPASGAYFMSRAEQSRSHGGRPIAVTVCGEATAAWLNDSTGELVVGWTDRDKSEVLVANTADFTVDELVISAESVYDCCG